MRARGKPQAAGRGRSAAVVAHFNALGAAQISTPASLYQGSKVDLSRVLIAPGQGLLELDIEQRLRYFFRFQEITVADIVAPLAMCPAALYRTIPSPSSDKQGDGEEGESKRDYVHALALGILRCKI